MPPPGDGSSEFQALEEELQIRQVADDPEQVYGQSYGPPTRNLQVCQELQADAVVHVGVLAY